MSFDDRVSVSFPLGRGNPPRIYETTDWWSPVVTRKRRSDSSFTYEYFQNPRPQNRKSTSFEQVPEPPYKSGNPKHSVS